MAQMVKNLPAMWETWVQSLGWEGPLEKRIATCSSSLAWRIPRTEEPGGYGSWGCKESDIGSCSAAVALAVTVTIIAMLLMDLEVPRGLGGEDRNN